MIDRQAAPRILKLLKGFPVVTVTGPRQSGKTTLVRAILGIWKPNRGEVRLDGAFFQPQILRFLDAEGLDYAVKVPLWKWLGIREQIANVE